MNSLTLSKNTPLTILCEDQAFIDYIRFWARKYVTRPIQGFEQKKSVHGSTMTEKELLKRSHLQIIHAACYFHERGKPLHEIMEIISFFKK
jgi:hypothetical protein